VTALTLPVGVRSWGLSEYKRGGVRLRVGLWGTWEGQGLGGSSGKVLALETGKQEAAQEAKQRKGEQVGLPLYWLGGLV